MGKIRNLKGGIFYRPVDTKMGKAGWCAELSYEKFIPRPARRKVKVGDRLIPISWTQHTQLFGPYATESEVKENYEPVYAELLDILNKKSD